VLRGAVRPVKTSDVLSEGESRIVSLAAFLADAEGRSAVTPFIFDDPISSLDDRYQEAVAIRLVKLGESRQVIVFTHRLTLVALLQKHAEKAGRQEEFICLDEHNPGSIAELRIDRDKPDKAANRLLNEKLAAAKKAFAANDGSYQDKAEALCGNIRTLMEIIVERLFINGVIARLDPEVHTREIYKLLKITAEDCKFVDDFMTKYSNLVHSQSADAPATLPRPEEFEEDLKAITEFISKLKQRT
jgi:hypothetical protein